MGRHFNARPNPKNSDPHACGRLKATGRPTRILSPHRAQCTNPASTRRALKAPGGQDKRRSSKQVQRFEPPPPTRGERPKRANQPAPSCGAFRLPTQKPPTEGVWGAAGVRRQSPRARSLTFRTVGLRHRAVVPRWLGRLARESDDLSLDDVQLATAVLQALPRRPDSALHILTGSGRRVRTGSLFRARRHGARAVGGRPPAPPRLRPKTIATSRKKGYPARGCAPRPAARVVCSAGASWSTDVLWERPHSPGAPTYLLGRPGRPRTWVDRGHAPPLRPCDRPGPKAGGALRVRDARSAKPHSGAAEYCRCLCRMQHESRVSPRRRDHRMGNLSRLKLSDVIFWILAGISAASRSCSSSPA